MLEILFQDKDIIAINKPHGLLVHRSPIAADASEFAIQMLREQIGQMVYPAHRLDRKTSGVLLFALNKVTERALQMQFDQKKIYKSYLSIVRGYTSDTSTIDYALKNEKEVIQDAITHFKTLQKAEIPLNSGKHPSSRYSLVQAEPETGRMHQIRKHFAHIFHPILGDRPHGCNKQNKLWLENFAMNKMMLHAYALGFYHPSTKDFITIKAAPSSDFKRVSDILSFDISRFVSETIQE
jgi:tRNA pseudouridine65 synthase